MAKQTVQKTNAMRILDSVGAVYKAHAFDCPEAMSGTEVADFLGLDRGQVFKTLVTQGKSGEHYVFLVPVAEELDLKKASDAVGEKSVHMIRSKELLPLTGYIHGGCSPLGMKKAFRTVVDETALLYDSIYFSAGKLGCQIETDLDGLGAAIGFSLADLTSA